MMHTKSYETNGHGSSEVPAVSHALRRAAPLGGASTLRALIGSVVAVSLAASCVVEEEEPAVASIGQALGDERQDAVIATGVRHTCAVLRDGRVACWGDNTFGQLGDGTTTDRHLPTTVPGLSQVVAVTAGQDFTCALRGDGTVRCWGSNASGQLGDGTTTARTTPTAVIGLTFATGAIAISAGLQHVCVRAGNGLAKCWGENEHGQLGDGTTTDRSSPVVAVGLDRVSAVAAGSDFTCAIEDEWWVSCWGRTLHGQLGDGTTTNRQLPTLASTATIRPRAIATGSAHACAVTAIGTVQCWGDNLFGQLGDGTLTTRHAATPVSSLTGITSLEASGRHTCARHASASLSCWGDNLFGQLGTGDTTASLTPVFASLGAVTHVAANGSHSCARTGDGAIWCWGRNSFGELGDGTTTQRLSPTATVPIDTATPAIATGGDGTDEHSCGLIAGGRVACWGGGLDGQLGDGSFVDRLSPVVVTTASGEPLGFVTDVVTGALFSCALRSTGRVYCWGDNTVGQLGTGTSGDSARALLVPGPDRAIAITAGTSHACMLTVDGLVRCWGENGAGQLGDGTTVDRPTPVAVTTISDVVSLSAGELHTCAVRTYGHVNCWGSDTWGQRGFDVPAEPFGVMPIVTGITDAIEVSSGGYHSCALLSSGEVRCWGYNGYGALGDATTTVRTTPVRMQLSYPATELAAGRYHTCVIVAPGHVRCTGRNNHGQLGDGTTTNRLTALAVAGGGTMVDIAAGGRQSCGIRADGTAACWGDNWLGQLGNGTSTPSLVPTSVVSFP